MFLLHNEEERENWVAAIKKLIPKGEDMESHDSHMTVSIHIMHSCHWRVPDVL